MQRILINYFSKRKIKELYFFKKFKKKVLGKNISQILSDEICNLTYYKNNFLENYFINKESSDKIISQYFISKIFLKTLNKNIVKSYEKKVSFPINLSMSNALNKYIQINKYLSTFYFFILIIKNLLISFFYFFYKIFEFIFRKNYNLQKIQNDSYFISLHNEGCLTSEDKLNENIFSWFKKNENDEKSKLWHNVKTSKENSRLMYLKSPVNIFQVQSLIKFFLMGIFFFISAIFNLFFCRWKMCLLSKEILSRLIVKYSSKEHCFKNYYFNNTSWVLKPLWTYEVEKKGSEVILYFISMNIENIKKNDDKIHLSDQYWKICTWNKYLVWNESHKSIMKNFVSTPEKNFEITGPIPYSDIINKYLLKQNLKKKIAIFDISPHRNYHRMHFNTELKFYKFEVIRKFILDILSKNRNNEFLFYLKIKRPINKSYFDKRYVNFIKSLAERNDVVLLPPELSAFRLAKFCDGAISLPFTSTSHIFKSMKKNTIFYDPIKFFDKQHLAARGIKIFYEDELTGFLNKL